MHQLGVLAAGFILVAIQGNSPYFPRYQGATSVSYLYLWLLISSIIASIISCQFSPKPFYHFAAGRFRQQMQARQAEELRSKTKQEK